MRSFITHPIASRVFFAGLLALILSTAGWLAKDNPPAAQPAQPPEKDTAMTNTATFAAGCCKRGGVSHCRILFGWLCRLRRGRVILGKPAGRAQNQCQQPREENARRNRVSDK